MSPYNTIASFRDGLLVQIMHASYPFGPEEESLRPGLTP